MNAKALYLLGVFLLVLTAFNIYATYLNTGPKNPLRYSVPQIVLSSVTLKPGESLITRGSKCNDSDEPVTIEGNGAFYVRLDAHGVIPNPKPGSTLTIAAHECIDRIFTSVLPAMEPGTWRVQGRECILPEKTFCKEWYSQNFEVSQ